LLLEEQTQRRVGTSRATYTLHRSCKGLSIREVKESMKRSYAAIRAERNQPALGPSFRLPLSQPDPPAPITKRVNPIRSRLVFTAMPDSTFEQDRWYNCLRSSWATPLKSTFRLRRHGPDKAFNPSQRSDPIIGAFLGIQTLNRNRPFGRKFRYHATGYTPS
jgi:hypothetical protein